MRGKESAEQENQNRKAPIARDETVREYGKQPLARRIDDTAADNAGGVAAKAHRHCKRLFAARAAALKRLIEIERHARQIADVFKEREQRKKDSHRR